eukprot:scaffold97553_cov17-Prasinocladus_malaysianus.AAC.1
MQNVISSPPSPIVPGSLLRPLRAVLGCNAGRYLMDRGSLLVLRPNGKLLSIQEAYAVMAATTKAYMVIVPYVE